MKYPKFLSSQIWRWNRSKTSTRELWGRQHSDDGEVLEHTCLCRAPEPNTAPRLDKTPKCKKSRKETALQFTPEMPPLEQSMQRRCILSMVQLTPLLGQKGPMLSGHKTEWPTASQWGYQKYRLESHLILMKTYCASNGAYNIVQMRVLWRKYCFLLNLHPDEVPISLSPQLRLTGRATMWNLEEFIYKDTLSPWSSSLPSLSLFLRIFYSSECFKYLMKSISIFRSPYQASSSNPRF